MCTGSADLIVKNPSERSERGRTKLLTGHKNLNISKTKADIEKKLRELRPPDTYESARSVSGDWMIGVAL